LGGDGEVDVLLSISVGKQANTRADNVSAVSKKPAIVRIRAFFCKDDMIVREQAATLNEKGDATFTGIPVEVNKIYIIGYPTTAGDAPPVITGIWTVDALQKVMIDMQKQSLADPTMVNTYGESTTLDLSSVAAGGPVAVGITVMPVASRIEILKIDPAHPPKGTTIKQEITAFDLNAIYINNTYTQVGLDGATVPTAADKIVSFGGLDIGNTSPWGNAAKYYTSGYYDNDIGTGKGSYTPAVDAWSYYVPALSASAGTTINDTVQSAMPHIVLKMSNLKVAGDANIIKGPLFLTVKNYTDDAGTPVDHLQAGSVYQIENLAFGLEQLGMLPEMSPGRFAVRLSVVGWEQGTVSGGVD
jgi:hypothetical protein